MHAHPISIPAGVFSSVFAIISWKVFAVRLFCDVPGLSFVSSSAVGASSVKGAGRLFFV